MGRLRRDFSQTRYLHHTGDEIYGQLYPFWDGEDDVFNIRSAEDAALLPNLNSVTLFYDDDERILEEFRQRGIAAEWL